MPAPTIQDFMFGDHIRPENRLAEHRRRLTGVQHQADATPPRPRSGQPIRIQATTAGPIPFDCVRVFYTLDGAAPAPGQCPSLDLVESAAGWDQVDWQAARQWQGHLPGQADDTLIRYRIAARVTGSDRWLFADNQGDAAETATNFALWVSDIPAPAWAATAQIYHVFLDRFYPGDGKPWQTPAALDGFFGGAIDGVTEKLDYIQGLGYTTIWLSPFFASPSHHGYDATDMYRVEPRLGANADLDRLIAAAHSRGLRLILDFVANHWSHLHPSLLAAQKERASAYHDWYIWQQWPDEYEGYFGVKTMPRLNLALGSPARAYLLDCARHWLEKGFDGFRLDFAYGPPLDFWVDFRRACKTAKADAWLFGEVIQDAAAQRTFAVAFDGMIDFLLAEALRQTFGYGRWPLDRFVAYLDGHEAYFGDAFDRLTILDNHDMNRFLFLAGDDRAKLKLGALLLYTLAGNPINYYGTETGVTQERPTHYDGKGVFEEARQPMNWDAAIAGDLPDHFRTLVQLRHAHPALRQGSRRTVHLDAGAGTWAFERRTPDETLLIALNTGPTPRLLTLPSGDLHALADLLGGLPLALADGRVHIALPPQTGAVLGDR